MPEHEPSSCGAGQQSKTRIVRALATSTNTLWLHCDDVEWLVTWVANEHKTGGIPTLDPAAAGEELKGNCSVPGVHIRWDFNGAWEAIILAGEKKGATVKSHVAKCTAEKWLAIGGQATYGIDFESATENHLKAATFEYLEKRMKEVVCPQLRT